MNYKFREKQSEHQFLKRTSEFDYHHMTPRDRGGSSVDSNFIRLELYRHDALHYLFFNMTLKEIIRFLKGLRSIEDLYSRRPYSKNAVKLLFHNMTLSEIIFCLKRIKRIKKKLWSYKL